MINANSSLTEFQAANYRIYSVANDRNYDSPGILSRLHRHITHILKGVRKGKHDDLEYHLCMALSWAFALANRFYFNVADKMWEFFPGHCPYCLHVPCACRERADARQPAPASRRDCPVSSADWQKMFADIYPNLLQNSAMHLAEEAGEVSEALRVYLATHQKEWLDKIEEELIDVVTNIYGVANCLRLNLSVAFAGYFANGCPGCKQHVCTCGYVMVDHPIHLDG